MPFITTLLDFSISYATETTTLWDFLCGNMSKIRIKVREIDIPEHLLNKDYSTQPEYREDLKKWLYEIWETKDNFLKSN